MLFDEGARPSSSSTQVTAPDVTGTLTGLKEILAVVYRGQKQQ